MVQGLDAATVQIVAGAVGSIWASAPGNFIAQTDQRRQDLEQVIIHHLRNEPSERARCPVECVHASLLLIVNLGDARQFGERGQGAIQLVAGRLNRFEDVTFGCI